MTRLDLTLRDPAATERLGHFIAGWLKAGDVVALDGPLGAGKSVLARAIIRHVCPQEDDIPSPTFTLVHFDLYRLDSPEDALELGIEDAFIDSVCLVEWAQRLGPYLPRTALNVAINPGPDNNDTRAVSLAGGGRWQTLITEIDTQMQGVN
jgi:tRNA threonylcarbamoyladenosine biosynthesis protein TsaE